MGAQGVRDKEPQDDQDFWSTSSKLGQQRSRDVVRPGAALNNLLQLATGAPGHVEQGPERARCEERVTVPQRIRVDRACCSENRRSNVVFPTPASPPTKTTRPRDFVATAASDSPSAETW
jgi:hypothetical protein